MAIVSKSTIKTKFENGDYPDEDDFIDLIDSMPNPVQSGTQSELTGLDFSDVDPPKQIRSMTLTANRTIAVSGLSVNNPVGLLEVTHGGYTPTFTGVTALNDLEEVGGKYFLKFQWWPSGTITMKSLKGELTVITHRLFYAPFTGTVIDTTVNWDALVNPATPAPALSQNDGFIGSSDGSGLVTSLTNYLPSKPSFDETGKLCLQVEFPSDTFTGATYQEGVAIFLRQDASNYIKISLKAYNVGTGGQIAVFGRTEGAEADYNVNSGAASGIGKMVKVEFDNVGNTIEAFYCTIGGGDDNWTSLGVADLDPFTDVAKIYADFRNGTTVFTSKVRRVWLSDEFYTSEIPPA